MIEKVDPKFVPMYIKKDPVRPHINAETRMMPGRDVYHIDEKAFVCLAYLDRVPADEETLLSANIGPVVVAYTCLLYTSPSPRDKRQSRMPSSA